MAGVENSVNGDTDWDNYNKDKRTACKYGPKCYQKNHFHQNKFKHPPSAKRMSTEMKNEEPSAKTTKTESSEDEDETSKLPKAVITTDADTSEDNVTTEGTETTENPETSKNGTTDDHDVVNDDEDYSDNDKSTEPIEEELPSSPVDVKENIKQKFLVDMPADFYDLWSFCTIVNKDKPEDALSVVGLTLVGPYDVMSGKLKQVKKRLLSDYLCHWRYYYDPPEFQTVIAGDKEDYHLGYFRDDPNDDPVFVGSMSQQRHMIVTPLGGNIFAAISTYITNRLKSTDTFQKTNVQKLQQKLDTYAKDQHHSLSAKTDKTEARKKLVVTKSLHGAGIVVPYDKKNDVGYREIPETDADLKKILKRIIDAKNEDQKGKAYDDLQEIITNVQWATDEGDTGMGLELGIDLLVYGGEEFHSSIKHLLTVAYDLLGRGEFSKIILAHLKNRRKGCNLSIIGD